MNFKRQHWQNSFFLLTTLLVLGLTKGESQPPAEEGSQAQPLSATLRPAATPVSRISSSSIPATSERKGDDPNAGRNPGHADKKHQQPSSSPNRVPPLLALLNFLFRGDRRRGSDSTHNNGGNMGSLPLFGRQSRIFTTANKPLVSFQEQNQLINVAFPTKTNEFGSLSNQPRVATVTIASAVGRTAVGRVIFFQENVIQSVSLIGSISGLPASGASLKLEIRTSSNADCSVLGALFNPTGADQGGIITTTGTSSAGGLWNLYTTALPIYRISLFDPNSILGRSLVVSQNGIILGCGRILAT